LSINSKHYLVNKFATRKQLSKNEHSLGLFTDLKSDLTNNFLNFYFIFEAYTS